MKIIKFLLFIIFVFLLVLFFQRNYNQVIELSLIFSGEKIKIEAVIALFVALLIGLLIGLIYGGINILAMKSKIRALNKENENLKKEIDLLRNQGVLDEEGNL